MTTQPIGTGGITAVTQSTRTIVIDIGPVGTPGPPGPPGPAGSPGAPGVSGGVSYTHVQSILSQDWHVVHNLHRRPTVQAENSAGEFIIGTLKHLSDDDLTIHFAVKVTGKVNCT